VNGWADWNIRSGFGPGVDYRRAVTAFDKAWISTRLGSGNVLLRINGTIGSGSYQIKVDIDPPPPGLPDGQVTVSQYAAWTEDKGPMYMTVLDPDTDYTIKITNVVQGDFKWLNIQRFDLWNIANFTDSGSGGTGNGTEGVGATGGADGATEKKPMIPVIVGCVVSHIEKQR
jgi:hypothetical protein